MLLKKQNKVEMLMNIPRKGVFGSIVMVMSCLKMLNMMSGASAAAHHQSPFLTARRRMIHTCMTPFDSVQCFPKE